MMELFCNKEEENRDREKTNEMRRHVIACQIEGHHGGGEYHNPYGRVVGSIKSGKMQVATIVSGKTVYFDFERLAPGVWSSCNSVTRKLRVRFGKKDGARQ
jgi:hypothetical protein